MTRYSEEFKNAIIHKILSPNAPSIRSVAKEHDVPIASVLNWLRQAKTNPTQVIDQRFEKLMKEDTAFSVEKRFKIIIETASLSPEELSAYCRNRGLYVQDIEVWKQEMMDNLDSRNKKRLATENRGLKIKVRELETELRCKEKALAETSALLLLKKKARIIWGDLEEER